MVPREVVLGSAGAVQDRDLRITAPRRPTVVICGSMRNHTHMVKIADRLRAAGLRAVVPIPDQRSTGRSADAVVEQKRAASKRHMDHILHADTDAVLVVNVGHPGASDYVGPNAFAEIGVAFSSDRPVFLLNGMPEDYSDELVAWGVQCLNGDLRPLLDELGCASADWT